MMQSTKFHSCYIYGDTSTGKTYTIEKLLGDKAKFITTHITPLALYILLYNFSDQVIVLDDLDKLDDSLIAILKASLWEVNGARRLNWVTTSKILEEKGIPNEFEFTGKIIITSNNNSTYKKFEPLLARMLVVNQVLTREEFSNIAKKIFDNYEIESFEEFKQTYINLYTENLHLRNVLKYCEYYKNQYKDQADKLFTINEPFKFFEVSQVSSVSSLQKKFEEKFGLGRATFFRHWKRFKELKSKGW